MPAPTPPEILRICCRRIEHGHKIVDVALDAKITARTIYRAMANKKAYGDVVPRRQRPGRKPKIDEEVVDSILQLLESRPLLYLNQIQQALEDIYGVVFSISSIWKTLDKIKWTRQPPESVCTIETLR